MRNVAGKISQEEIDALIIWLELSQMSLCNLTALLRKIPKDPYITPIGVSHIMLAQMLGKKLFEHKTLDKLTEDLTDEERAYLLRE